MRSPTDASSRIREVRLAALDLRYRSVRLPSPPQRQRALAESLERHGQQQPVLVSDGVEQAGLVLLDGYKRIDVLASRGAETVLASVESLDAPAALVAIMRANASRRGLSALEEAWIALALQNEHGLTQAEVAERLGRDKSWVCRRLKLVTDLERQVQDDVRLGLVTPTVARELARLPRGNQASAAQAASRHALTSRQVTKLVGVLLATDPAQRRDVLANPLAHLTELSSRSTEPPQDPRLGDQANRVRQQLLRIHAATNRLQEVLLDAPSLGSSETRLLSELAPPIVAAARTCFSHLEATLTAGAAREPCHAG